MSIYNQENNARKFHTLSSEFAAKVQQDFYAPLRTLFTDAQSSKATMRDFWQECLTFKASGKLLSPWEKISEECNMADFHKAKLPAEQYNKKLQPLIYSLEVS